jgi:TRAP-type C4-dicarboxylate transport system substrate-binding protein
VMVPDDIKGMKIRPAQGTIARFVTLLGGTNVQASAPQVRETLARGVADAVTFPWGSIILFGIDKVTKYHMNVPLYVTTFAFVFNKAKYDQMSDKQKKVIDNHCNAKWAEKVAAPWADFEHDGIAKLKAESGQDVYDISAAQLAEWQKAAKPLEAAWADGAKKAGVDPAKAISDLRSELKKNNAAY